MNKDDLRAIVEEMRDWADRHIPSPPMQHTAKNFADRLSRIADARETVIQRMRDFVLRPDARGPGTACNHILNWADELEGTNE